MTHQSPDPRTAIELDESGARLLLGLTEPLRIDLMLGANHHWRVTSPEGTFYVKAHTRSWYDWDPHQAANLAVRQEQAAYRMLSERGIATPEVVYASATEDNPLGWPCIVTRELEGRPLDRVVQAGSPAETERSLRTAGEYLGTMHGITMTHPGYLIDGPPSEPPPPGSWKSPAWMQDRFLTTAVAGLGSLIPGLPGEIADEIGELFSVAVPELDDWFNPPRFITGDCHAGHMFLRDFDGEFEVTGLIDMELASAGTPLADLFKTTVQLAPLRGIPDGWWEHLFAGYGRVPSLAAMKLYFAAEGIESYRCFGEDSWPVEDRPQVLRHLLRADSWSALFDLRNLL